MKKTKRIILSKPKLNKIKSKKIDNNLDIDDSLKTTNLGSARKYHIPIIGIISILISIFYWLEPNIIVVKMTMENSDQIVKWSNGKIVDRKVLVIDVINTSIRPGYINSLIIKTEGINCTAFKILDEYVEKEYLFFKVKKKIRISWSTIQYSLERNEDLEYKDNFQLKSEALVLRLFDNFNNPLLDSGEKEFEHAIISVYGINK